MPVTTQTPEAIAAKYVRRGQNAVTDWETGVRAVTVSPTAKAALSLDKAKQNYIEAIDSGKMARGLNRVTKEEWIDKTITLGRSRYPTGIAAAEGKMVKFMGALLPFQRKLAERIDKMPTLTKQQAIAKMVAQVEGMMDFPGY